MEIWDIRRFHFSHPSNAFDTASLLIALLRAAEIPARYRYGTVRIPESQARNWLGNLRSPTPL